MMSLPLPTLDDRRWADLVEEGRALIPLYGPDWTDHNIHDPGIMLMELLAWVTEMDIYWLNQVPDEHKRKFLALAGISPRPPRPARTIFQFQLRGNSPAQHLPASFQIQASMPDGTTVPFETLQPITIVPGRLAAIQREEDSQFVDLSGLWQRSEPLLPWGSDPKPGTCFYLGLTKPLPDDAPSTLYFRPAEPRAGQAEKRRISEEQVRRAAECPPPPRCEEDKTDTETTVAPATPHPPAHHDVHLEWSYWSSAGRWHTFETGTQIWDETRALTLDGRIIFTPSRPMAARTLGDLEEPYYYLRCQIVYGAFDKAPELAGLALNGVLARQAIPVGQYAWPIASGAQLPAEALDPGQVYSLHLELDDQCRITRLDYKTDSVPRLRVLDYSPPASTEGHLTVEAILIKDPGGSGRPLQELSLPESSVLSGDFHLHTYEDGRWRSWEQRFDFDASNRKDAHYLLDATAGRVNFGDGERGRVVPPYAPILVAYHATQAADGNLGSEKATPQLAESLHNKALVGNVGPLIGALENVTMPFGATGGRAAETVDEATGRALDDLAKSRRAVSVEDYQKLATDTPGVHVARVAVRENYHPSFPCFVAPGVMTVLVLPFLPAGRPFPSAGLQREIARYLNARRVIGTRIEVIGPTYKEVIVRARVQACVGVDPVALQQQIVDRLHSYFSALPPGGPEGDGWPFGRDVYRSEVLQVLDEERGVENVLSLELLADICQPSCSNICVGPLGLAASGPHEIEIVG